jgi:hypothetical protein
MKRIMITAASVLAMALLPGCSSGGLSASNKVVCADVAEIMKGSGYMQGTRESLMKAVVKLAYYDPDPIDDWITYVSPLDGEYRPSLYDNDNAVYQNLYRLQEQAISYADTRNSGAYYNEWEYFEKGCGFIEE